MTILAKATKVHFDDAQMWVELEDGRTLGIPLAWYPLLLHGTAAQRDQASISATGIHWRNSTRISRLQDCWLGLVT
jgi:hypothetical protein